jgi:hypothetical protein
MNTKIITTLSLACSLFFASCDPESYSPVVTIDAPTEAPSLVPNMYLENQFNATMFVGKTQDVLAVNKNYSVANATIELYENEVLKSGWIKSTAADTPYYRLPEFKPTPGNIYRTNVTAPNLPAAQAIDTMPLPIQFTVSKTGKTILFDDKENQGPFGGQGFLDTLVEVKLTFTDNANKKDYYRIIVDENETNCASINEIKQTNFIRKHPIHSNDIIYKDAVSGGPDNIGGGAADIIDLRNGFFTDVTFNGKQKEIIFYVPIGKVPDFMNNDLGYDKAYFAIQHLSRSAYLHASSVANYNDQDGAFSQPSLVFSNYKNGFGILGCNTATVQSIQVR